MTAGQRNCYIMLDECARNYHLDDVLAAVGALMDDKRRDSLRGSAESVMYENFVNEIEHMRNRMSAMAIASRG